MSRLAISAVALVMCGCQEPTVPAPPSPAVATDEAQAASDARDAPSMRVVEPDPVESVESIASIAPAASRGVVTSMHGTVITVLALTDAATAAVTADFRRSVRLWPTLDGTREPVVVAMQSPAQLALAPTHGGGFVIAGVDDVGQLELVQTATTGEVQRRVAVDTGRPLVAIHAVSNGFVGLRDDHSVIVVGQDGSALGVVVADPGDHVASLAVRRDRVLAIVEAKREVRGRWIELAGGAHWGERTAALPIQPVNVVLAPAAARVAGLAKNRKSVVIADLTRGKVIARVQQEEFVDPKLRAIGFLRDDVLAIDSEQGVRWWGREGFNMFVRDGMLAVGDAHVVGADLTVLVIGDLDRDHPRTLGYGLGTPSSVLPVEDRLLITDTRSIVELDAKLHTRLVHELPDDAARNWFGVTLLDPTHAVGFSYTQGGSAVYMIDLATHEATEIADKASIVGFLRTTGLLVLTAVNEILVARYDANTATLGALQSIPVDMHTYPRVQLLEPAQARGNVLAVATTADYTAVHLQLYKRATGNTTDVVSPGASKDVPVEPNFLDVNDSLNVLDRLLLIPPGTPSPDGASIAVIAEQRITLRDRTGNTLWTIPSDGAAELAWTPSGELVAFGAGMSRIDAKSGVVRARQCGWKFGLWDQFAGGFGTASQCEAAAHF